MVVEDIQGNINKAISKDINSRRLLVINSLTVSSSNNSSRRSRLLAVDAQ
jgi:hypothetical protein